MPKKYWMGLVPRLKLLKELQPVLPLSLLPAKGKIMEQKQAVFLIKGRNIL
jgi:hypothetical protein